MKILIIERTTNRVNPFNIRVGTLEGGDQNAGPLSNIQDLYIDPANNESLVLLDNLKKNSDAIWEVDHISTMENKMRLK